MVPAAMATRPDNPAGTLVVDVLPRDQAATEPSARKARLYSLLAAMATAFDSPAGGHMGMLGPPARI